MAGTCFIVPAALLVLALAWAYVRFGSRPEAVGLLHGVAPVIVAIVVQALWRLGRHALKSRALTLLALLAVILNALGIDELIVLFGAGLVAATLRRVHSRGRSTPGLCAIPIRAIAVAAPVGGMAGTMATPFGLLPLFLFFLKVGSVLFGSGYVLLAFLRSDLVVRWGWLTDAQLLDAIAVGQVTPGPVFATATFIGYLLGGLPGAAVATLGIFLPSFFFVALSGPLIPRLRSSVWAGAFLDGVNVASLALMAVVTWRLGRAAIDDQVTLALALALVSGCLLFRSRLNSVWLILAGGLMGLLSHAALGGP